MIFDTIFNIFLGIIGWCIQVTQFNNSNSEDLLPLYVASNNEIVLIRGLPGSGKSTLARTMLGYEHYEADMFLMVDGQYVYDASKVKAAHDWCVALAKESLDKGLNVVVSNTFVKVWEMDRYIKLGYKYRIIELKTRWENIHGVPEDKINEMSLRWEPL